MKLSLSNLSAPYSLSQTSYSLHAVPKWKSKTKQVSLAPKFTKHIKYIYIYKSHLKSSELSVIQFSEGKTQPADGGNGTACSERMNKCWRKHLSESSLEFSFYLNTLLHKAGSTCHLLRAAVWLHLFVCSQERTLPPKNTSYFERRRENLRRSGARGSVLLREQHVNARLKGCKGVSEGLLKIRPITSISECSKK